MTSSEYGRISDELLSAYIDNAVSEQERDLVEAVVAVDSEVAWRLDTLQHTVQLLRSLPELALPRSFTLQESQILESPPRGEYALGDPSAQSVYGRIVSGWRSFWQPGSAVYRNLAAASLAVLLFLVGGSRLTSFPVGDFYAPADEIAFSEAPAREAAPAMTDTDMTVSDAASSDADTAAEIPIVDEAAAGAEVAEGPLTDAAQAAGSAEESIVAESASIAAKLPSDPGSAVAKGVLDAAESAAEGAMGETAQFAAAPAEAPLAAAPVPGSASAPLPRTESAPGDPLEFRVAPGEGIGSGADDEQESVAEDSVDLFAGLAEESDEAATAFVDDADTAGALLSDAGDTAGVNGESHSVFLQDGLAEQPASAPLPEMEGSNGEPASSGLMDESEADTIAADVAEVADEPVPPEMSETEDPRPNENAISAVPTAAIQPLSAAESPPTIPYPAPEEPTRAGIRSLAPMQFYAFGLLFATVIFGGLWWHSRSQTEPDTDV